MDGKINRYQILKEISTGNFANIYLAYDPRFERKVILKVLRDLLLGDQEFRIRFEQETKIVAKMEHNAIVPVYDFGEFQQRPYLVMRFLSGGTLRRLLDQEGSLSLDDTYQITKRLASALDEAHKRGIVHRDIKPENVLLDNDGLPYLSDFGLAYLIEHSVSITRTDAVVGSYAYMAPEQWRGEKADKFTDVYQFGILLFEMLTGQHPFSTDDPTTYGYQHINAPIPSAHAINSNLPLAIDGILAKAIAKKASMRFASVGEIAIALAQILQVNQIDRYLVKNELGHGNIACVYLAKDPIFERDVAVKILKEEIKESSILCERFMQEAKAIAQLEHPAIVSVYDFGYCKDRPFLVMRYMSGGSLLDRLRITNSLPLEQSIRYIERLSGALSEMHAKGIIHRDIKPSNILFDKEDLPYLSDFGLVHYFGNEYTNPSGIKGTPAYMAPEQWNEERLDARTDIYQLGVLLFQMVTGQLPFEGFNHQEVMQAHLNGFIPSARRVKPDLPIDFDKIIATAMAKCPDNRYTNVENFSVALANIFTPFQKNIKKARFPKVRNLIFWAAISLILWLTVFFKFEVKENFTVFQTQPTEYSMTALPTIENTREIKATFSVIILSTPINSRVDILTPEHTTTYFSTSITNTIEQTTLPTLLPSATPTTIFTPVLTKVPPLPSSTPMIPTQIPTVMPTLLPSQTPLPVPQPTNPPPAPTPTID